MYISEIVSRADMNLHVWLLAVAGMCRIHKKSYPPHTIPHLPPTHTHPSVPHMASGLPARWWLHGRKAAVCSACPEMTKCYLGGRFVPKAAIVWPPEDALIAVKERIKHYKLLPYWGPFISRLLQPAFYKQPPAFIARDCTNFLFFSDKTDFASRDDQET